MCRCCLLGVKAACVALQLPAALLSYLGVSGRLVRCLLCRPDPQGHSHSQTQRHRPAVASRGFPSECVLHGWVAGGVTCVGLASACPACIAAEAPCCLCAAAQRVVLTAPAWGRGTGALCWSLRSPSPIPSLALSDLSRAGSWLLFLPTPAAADRLITAPHDACRHVRGSYTRTCRAYA